MGIRDLLLIAASFASVTAAEAQFARSSSTPFPSNEWSRVLGPTSDQALPIGFYSHGCLRGGLSLPLEGAGYQAMRPFRNRFYGHPHLVSFLQKYGTELDALGSAVLVGDLGQARGGPMPYGHTSHQIGLDVDVWFWTHPEQRVRSLTLEERNNLPMPSVLNSNGIVDPTKFTDDHILKLKLAALDSKVERIFVNPAIKTYLCSTLPAHELFWLRQLRPWTGHDDHFHVRLACPVGDTTCTHQAPQAAGDGCKELMPDRLGIELASSEAESKMELSIEQLLESSLATALPAECAKVIKAN